MLLRRYTARISLASISPFCEFGLRFARTVVISRLLLPREVGAAVALTIIVTSSELITDVGLDKFVMISDDESRAQTIAAVRQISIIRAVVLATAIALLAPILSTVFGCESPYRAIAWLGMVPLVRSLRNWRVVQIQKNYRYGPEVASNILAQIGAIIAVAPSIVFFRDERVMLVSLLAESAIYVVFSYLFAPAERHNSVDPAVRSAALLYGLPLMVNGIGLVVLRQVDQIIVANLFGLLTLAHYSLALNLVMAATSPLQRIAGQISIPFLGNALGDISYYRRAALSVIVGTCILGAAYSLSVGGNLDRIVSVVYGSQYEVTSEFCALAMLLAFLRASRGGPNMVLLAVSRTARLSIGNMVAAIGAAIGFVLGVMTRRIEGVLIGVVVGDFLSLLLLMLFAKPYLVFWRTARYVTGLGAVIITGAAVLWSTCQGGLLLRAITIMLGTSVVVIVGIVFLREDVYRLTTIQKQRT